ncbi:hypothetical protein DFH08DRAFT_935000 [Mycena albidolilacea]|uniref:Uncharacterized protein n=1 Tax=Mycena albidolilacea TaxID=1033008 RepID=A0AAD7A856_9AGAR|nr:hypothetical protein DFH08DRAFT_935000 [Mycena albidolilacea]
MSVSAVSATSGRSSTSTASKSSKILATPEPTKATQTRTTRSVPNASQLPYLNKTRNELLGLTTSDSNWTEWRTVDVKNSLFAKGYITEAEAAGTHSLPPISLLALAALRVAASLPPNAAIAPDALRAVAVGLGFKRADTLLEGIAADLSEVLSHSRASLSSSHNRAEGSSYGQDNQLTHGVSPRAQCIISGEGSHVTIQI